jgi:nucleoside-diphosphate-sugar epimerase
LDSYEGGRERAPAAICRDVARAETTGVVDVFGDGRQTRSFIYVDDCVEGLHRVMHSDCALPLNLDTGEMTTLDQLVGLVAEVAGKSVRIRHHRWMPEGPRGCSSDNALSRHVLGWEPQTSLAEGLARTYAWIAQRVARSCPDVGATVVRASATGPLREHMITASG